MEYEALRDGAVVARGWSRTGKPRHAVVGRNTATGRYWWVGAYYNLRPAEKAMLKQHSDTSQGLMCEVRPATP